MTFSIVTKFHQVSESGIKFWPTRATDSKI